MVRHATQSPEILEPTPPAAPSPTPIDRVDPPPLISINTHPLFTGTAWPAWRDLLSREWGWRTHRGSRGERPTAQAGHLPGQPVEAQGVAIPNSPAALPRVLPAAQVSDRQTASRYQELPRNFLDFSLWPELWMIPLS